MHTNSKFILTAILLAGMQATLASSAFALPVSLGAASDYAVIGLGNSSVSTDFLSVYQSATVINGNVGMGPTNTWGHSIDATINGSVYYDTTSPAPTVVGTVTGGVSQVSMTSVVTDAVNASSSYAGLTPTQTFSTLTDGQTIVGNGGLNVIRVTGDVTLKDTLTLQGGASDVFVIQITAADAASAHTLTLSGVQMTLSGGLVASNVLWNMDGTGGGVVISSGANVQGVFLTPYRGITVDNATVLGSVIGGGGTDSHSGYVEVHSSSQITQAPLLVPDGGSTMALLGLALLSIWGIRRMLRA